MEEGGVLGENDQPCASMLVEEVTTNYEFHTIEYQEYRFSLAEFVWKTFSQKTV
jgi:hypothetical protein